MPTGFEHTAADEVKEKIGVDARIGKDRGRIYFPIATDKLFQVGNLKSMHAFFFHGISCCQIALFAFKYVVEICFDVVPVETLSKTEKYMSRKPQSHLCVCL